MTPDSDATVFDDTPCTLGEGPFWHTERRSLFWFDILAGRLHERSEAGAKNTWDFGEPASAAARIEGSRLLVATATGLQDFDLATGKGKPLVRFPQGAVKTRSNDGRADRQGGFWIGTMGLGAETGAGAIYRFYKGEFREVVGNISISNGIAFSPSGDLAYYTDTMDKRVWRQPLDAQGWPQGAPDVFLDLRAERLNPDGAVVDAEGCYHSAQWGSHRVARYSPEGTFLDAILFPPGQTSCPAFGGAKMNRLFVTTAREGMSAERIASQPLAGQTFVCETTFHGIPEPAILLS